VGYASNFVTQDHLQTVLLMLDRRADRSGRVDARQTEIIGGTRFYFGDMPGAYVNTRNLTAVFLPALQILGVISHVEVYRTSRAHNLAIRCQVHDLVVKPADYAARLAPLDFDKSTWEVNAMLVRVLKEQQSD
jgi:hypothetical protein